MVKLSLMSLVGISMIFEAVLTTKSRNVSQNLINAIHNVVHNVVTVVLYSTDVTAMCSVTKYLIDH